MFRLRLDVPHHTVVWLQVLAKLESRQALYAFKDIAYASDGVIMSRGNLGLDVVPEKMALVQKARSDSFSLGTAPDSQSVLGLHAAPQTLARCHPLGEGAINSGSAANASSVQLQLAGRTQARGSVSMGRAAAAHGHTDVWGAVLQAMVANCNIMGKPIIITRLVDTMSSNPRPTRCLLSCTRRHLKPQTAVGAMKCSAARMLCHHQARVSSSANSVCQPTSACEREPTCAYSSRRSLTCGAGLRRQMWQMLSWMVRMPFCWARRRCGASTRCSPSPPSCPSRARRRRCSITRTTSTTS